MAESATKSQWKSRAVTRRIEAGETTECEHCGERVKFRAREHNYQVICNVYVDSSWDHVEHFHAPCYDEAKLPFGEPLD